MFKFLHAADIHLDSPLRGLDRYDGAPAAECRGATRRAIENLVSLAMAESVAFVVIVGDLYDGDWPDYNTGLFFGTQMAKLREAGIPVYMIRGNHDAANKMTKDLRLADNVRVLASDSPETIVDDDLGVAVHGQSFASQAVTANLAKLYPRRRDGYFNIGLLHTCYNGREGHESYAPCSLDDLRVREYHYWALGHVHHREVLKEHDPWIVFPGNIQGRHAREQGPKGCMLVTVDDDQTILSAEPRWLDVMRWETCRVDVSGAHDPDDVIHRFKDRLTAFLPRNDGRALAVRVEIEGATTAHQVLTSRSVHWTNEIRQAATDAADGMAWVEKVKLNTRPLSRSEDSLLGDAPLAELSAYFDELLADDQKIQQLGASLSDLARKLPSDVLKELETPQYLRSLLEQARPMLLDRLMGK